MFARRISPITSAALVALVCLVGLVAVAETLGDNTKSDERVKIVFKADQARRVTKAIKLKAKYDRHKYIQESIAFIYDAIERQAKAGAESAQISGMEQFNETELSQIREEFTAAGYEVKNGPEWLAGHRLIFSWANESSEESETVATKVPDQTREASKAP